MISYRRKRNRPMAEINVVPYIDVMLVLLVIFMITAPLLSQGVHVNLPKAQARALSIKQKTPIIVSIDKSGKYYLNSSDNNNISLLPQQLMSRVAAELAIAKQTGRAITVLVKGDQAVSYAKVVQAMVLLQRAGVKQVGLMTVDPDKV
ncbi:MAG: protein TolR [Gammaproteobacteria bacterium]|jgi:biopolymer transport protein TolR